MSLVEASTRDDIESLKQELRRQCQRATASSTDDVDLLAIDLFASLVLQNESVIALEATKIIAEKFKSANPNEILQALNVLEECMSKCGSKFHSEVGKFRFLNELIRLVSPQYLGSQTVEKVRNKILDLLLLWTVSYPEESKIKEAYDMLITRGVHHELVKPVKVHGKAATNGLAGSNASKEPKRPDRDDAMAEKLKALLQSSNPADHKAANLLIQNMVKEKERRTEMRIRRKIELREIVDNATLLNEMLDQWDDEEASEDTLATIKDLYEACGKLRPTLAILAGETQENEILEETFEANDLLTAAFQKYDTVIMKRQLATNQDLLSGIAATNIVPSKTSASSKNAMDELQEIFASNQTTSTGPTNVLHSLPLEPELLNAAVVKYEKETNESAWQAIKDLNNSSTVNKFSNARALIPAQPTVNLIPSTSTIIVPDEPLPVKEPSMVSKYANLDSEITDMLSELKTGLRKEAITTTPVEPDLLLGDGFNEDEAILDHIDGEHSVNCGETKDLDTPTPNICDIDSKPISKNIFVKPDQIEDVRKPLSEMSVDINTILPHETLLPRTILDEKNGLRITLNFAKDRPRDDVTVLVITTTNHNSESVSNYQFDASVSRPCKLRLQPASGTELPGIKPFRPPTEDITQILLISNAERKPFKLVCIISYLMGSDPDPVKESMEITDLPYLNE